MPKLTEKQLLARDAKRDLNAELLTAATDLAKGRVGRVHVPSESDGGIRYAKVTQSVRKLIEFQQTVNAVRRRNAKTSPVIVEAEIAQAVRHVRAGLLHNRG